MIDALLVVSLSIGTCTGGTGLGDEQTRVWEGVLARAAFMETLSTIARADSWPAVHSSQFATKLTPEEARSQQLLRDVSRHFVTGLQQHVLLMKAMRPEEFVSDAGLLLDARDRLSACPGYVNAVVADSIDRVLFCNLVVRLAATDADLPSLAALVRRVGQRKLSMGVFIEMAGGERGGPLLDARSVGAAAGLDLFLKVWPLLEGSEWPGYPKGLGNLLTFSLFEKLDLGTLLWRLAITDYEINTLLPGLLEYRQNAEDFSTADDYQKISATIGREIKHHSLGAEIFGKSLPAGDVARMLHEVASATIERHLLFDLK